MTPRGVGLAWIRSTLTEPITGPCVLWPYRQTPKGYGAIDVPGVGFGAHRIALILRDGPAPADRPLAIHGACHNPLCVIHVRWGTHAENEADKRRDGTAPIGSAHGMSQLTDDDVRAIRSRFVPGVRGQVSGNRTALAAEFGVSRSHISGIISRRFWPHVV